MSAPGPGGTSVVVSVYARGDRVLLRVGAGQTANLSLEQAGDLLDGLRTAFDQAACAKLNTLRPAERRTARPGGGAQ